MRPIRSIKTKLLIRIVISFVIMSIVVQGIVFVSFRALSLGTAEEKALAIAELIRDTITSFMVLGVYDKRDVFIERIKYARGLKELRVIRGKGVSKQFGNSKEGSHTATLIEEKVLETGTVKSELSEDSSAVQYRLVIPYKATTEEQVKCMNCHNVKEGEVLGAVSIVMDLTKQRKEGAATMSYMMAASLIFSFCTLYIIYVFFKPYTALFKKLRSGFEKAQDGDFTERLAVRLIDEAGDVASGFNTMVENLSQALSLISHKVSLLIGYQVAGSGNALKDTSKTVDMLINIYNFKRTIEKDKKKSDIFTRLEQILNTFGINEYSVYEVNQRNNIITTISACGDVSQSDRDNTKEHSNVLWCDNVIVGNAQECRANRTGNMVDSRDFPVICPHFRTEDKVLKSQKGHFCIPLYIGGQVGDVLQIVYNNDRVDEVIGVLPYIKSYLLEGEPVLEAKTFMELLKEQSLVDQLTGLYNRRYLDEISTNLCLQAVRRNTLLGILMIDIDFFKKVNDTYGHDAGDKVLKSIAMLIKTTVRNTDVVIRYGGEEIIVLLTDVVSGKSLELAEKIRQKVEDESIEISGGVLKKTVSIGVSEYPTYGIKFWQCVKYADAALYKAKESGRNKVVMYEHQTQSLKADM
ncbi:diguanylate cyclase [Candidatus Magnetomonas plexicatena]|uniref:diguanylate cyclase n=1 Tax=Candidatus Magnetomonas plexicatena TaxID=2552947 RepID=UPI001C7584AC|nr:diguanylate cyclase [Nitrospirales bacterium LBB_01]